MCMHVSEVLLYSFSTYTIGFNSLWAQVQVLLFIVHCHKVGMIESTTRSISQKLLWSNYGSQWNAYYVCMYTPYVHTLCTHPMCTPYVHTVCTHRIYTPYVHTLCTHTPYVHTVCTHHMYTPYVHTLCTHRMYTPYVHTVCAHRMYTPYVHTHRMYTPYVWIFDMCIFMISVSELKRREKAEQGHSRVQRVLNASVAHLAASLFTFLYFSLITSKFFYFQHEARRSEHLEWEKHTAWVLSWWKEFPVNS